MTSAERQELKTRIEARIKLDEKFRRAARAWLKAGDLGAAAEAPLVTKSVDALRTLRSRDEHVFEVLDLRRKALERSVDEQLGRRREDLLHAAQRAGCRAERRQDYDHVDCFRVDYRRTRVNLKLGSEKWGAFDETDGRRIFDRIREARTALDAVPFSRDGFFDTVQAAIRTAAAKRIGRDGKVPIRRLYPLVVIERQLGDSRFLKEPSARRFDDYSMCQFIYDLARFGASGWSTPRGERLSSQTPSMREVAADRAVTLPVLEGTRPGAQIAVLWIDKVQPPIPLARLGPPSRHPRDEA